MVISVSQEQGGVPVTVFHIQGSVVEEERQRKVKEAHDAGTGKVVLDLSDVPYMASSGLMTLHYIYTLLRRPILRWPGSFTFARERAWQGPFSSSSNHSIPARQ